MFSDSHILLATLVWLAFYAGVIVAVIHCRPDRRDE